MQFEKKKRTKLGVQITILVPCSLQNELQNTYVLFPVSILA